MRSGLIRAVAAAILLAPTAAFAHSGLGSSHGFVHGLAHPLDGLDHILAMITVGIFAWQLGGRAIWLVPASFLSAMAVGGTIAAAGVPLPWVEVGIAFSVIALGAMVALEVRAHLAIAAAIVGLIAIFHGYAHGSAMPFAVSGFTYAAGFMLATAVLHGVGIALGFSTGQLGETKRRLVHQFGGGAVAFAGFGILSQIA